MSVKTDLSDSAPAAVPETEMACPKCGARQNVDAKICADCGIVFEKYWRYHPPPGIDPATWTPPTRAVPPPPTLARLKAPAEGLIALLLPRQPELDGIGLWARAALLLILLIWGLRLIALSPASNGAGQSFFHLVNLPFHEAGHLLFRPFGTFMTSLGGTLGQLLMPLICAGTLLLKNHDPFGAAVACWWLGESFLDTAPYINDARAGDLPLLGGNFGHSSPYGFHDWEYLLTETGLLRLDHQLAWFSHGLGAAIMLLALAWGAILLFRQRRP
ncbi:MAG: zinc ribbon domain-containing protein [Chromatiaceae bacterium]